MQHDAAAAEATNASWDDNPEGLLARLSPFVREALERARPGAAATAAAAANGSGSGAASSAEVARTVAEARGHLDARLAELAERAAQLEEREAALHRFGDATQAPLRHRF